MHSVPNAGDCLIVVQNDEDAKHLAESRQRLSKQAMGSSSANAIMAQAESLINGNYDRREVIKLPLILKADLIGSVEAIAKTVQELLVSDSETICKIDIVHSGVGEVTFSDVSLATAAKAQIVAFNVGSGRNVEELAKASNVPIHRTNIVYDIVDLLQRAIKDAYCPPPPGVLIGRAEVMKLFKLGKIGTVAGCKVLEGRVQTLSKIRIIRGKRNQIYIGTIETLRVAKDVVSEVPVESECGMTFSGFQDFAAGDVIECFES